MKYNRVVIADACFWLGLLDNSDQHHEAALRIWPYLDSYKLVVPWPCVYEVLSTRTARNSDRAVAAVEMLLNPSFEILDDSAYRVKGVRDFGDINYNKYFSHSLVDCVLRAMLADVDIKIDVLVTFNSRDFADVCSVRQIEIVDDL